jgi:hypothetical protein
MNDESESIYDVTPTNDKSHRISRTNMPMISATHRDHPTQQLTLLSFYCMLQFFQKSGECWWELWRFGWEGRSFVKKITDINLCEHAPS